MQTDAAYLFDIRAQIDQQIHEYLSFIPAAQEGTIVGGSFKPKFATAELLFGDTLCNPGDDGNTYILHDALPILTTQPGDLYGPTGVEKTIGIPVAAGLGLLFRHNEDDSPQPQPGERYILHKTVATQGMPVAQYDAGLKHTNDGATEKDGLGGAHYGLNAGLTQASTKSNHTVTLNDTTQAVTVQTSNGLTSIYDDANKILTHVVAWTAAVYNPVTGNGSPPTIFNSLNQVLQTAVVQVAPNVNHTLDAINQISILNTSATVQQVLDGANLLATTKVSPSIISTLDGVNQFIKLRAGGLSTVLDVAGTISGTSNTISHIVPNGGIIGLGNDFAGNLASSTAAVNENLMNTSYSGLVNTQVSTNFQALATALHTIGVLTGPQLSLLLGLMVFGGAGVLQKIGNFTGSTSVRIAS